MTRNSSDAEDLVQDQLIRAFTGFSGYQHGNLHAWLMTIMTNTAINTHRSRQRRPTEVLTADLPKSPTIRNGGSSHRRCPEKCLLESVPSDRTLTALRQLPKADMEGLRYSKVADILGLPVGTVMSGIHRARQRLRHSPHPPTCHATQCAWSNCQVDSPTVRHESGGMADQRLIWGDRSVVDRIGGAAYDYAVEREWLARPSGLALWGTDTRVLYDSIRLIGDLPDGSAVLDVPCGGGLALRGLRSDQRVRYVAADISTDMLARARRRAADLGRDDIEFTEADIERMPFDDKEFDLCVSFSGLHCLPDPAAAVREITRCLKPGGRLVGDSVVRGAGLRQDLAIRAFRRVGVFGAGGTVDELRRWLTDAGLTVDRLHPSGAVAHFTATAAR